MPKCEPQRLQRTIGAVFILGNCALTKVARKVVNFVALIVVQKQEKDAHRVEPRACGWIRLKTWTANCKRYHMYL